jgi:hypothetical protein
MPIRYDNPAEVGADRISCSRETLASPRTNPATSKRTMKVKVRFTLISFVR